MSKIKEIIKNLLGRYYSLRYNIINSGGLYVGMVQRLSTAAICHAAGE